MENVQQNAISKCGHLDNHDIGTCTKIGVEGMRTISTNAIRGCVVKLYYFCGGVERMC